MQFVTTYKNSSENPVFFDKSLFFPVHLGKINWTAKEITIIIDCKTAYLGGYNREYSSIPC